MPVFSNRSEMSTINTILGDPGAASRDDGIFTGESLQQEQESPWALTLTDLVPEAFEFSPSDWPGDSDVFLHEVVFLINSRSSVARSTGTFFRRASEKKNKRSRGNRKL